MAYSETEIRYILKVHSEKTEQWVIDARKKNLTLKALVTGEGFHGELINRIEHLESSERAEVRKKYSKDIRDLFSRIMKKRQNVFDADGGSENNQIKSETIIKDFEERLSNFKANKSLFSYLSESYFQLQDIDPNGVVMLEYQTNPEIKLYPAYKSIHDIRFYESEGQRVKYIVFEPKIHKESFVKSWRIVDEQKDYTFLEIQGSFFLDETKTFNHPFGYAPALILSNKCKVGSEERISPIEDVVELAKDYARDKSVLTIYKFQKGNPLHYRYGDTKCKPCHGTGKQGDSICSTCSGKGQQLKSDVSDIYYIPIPKEGQPFLSDKIAGFSSPDLETWKQYKEDLRDMELLIEDTIWGTDKTHQIDKANETATGRFIDVQPISIVLNSYSNNVEYVYNTLANWTLNFVDLTKKREELFYQRTFGRRYIIESPDVLIEKYGNAKEKGANNTILDKLMEEYILSKYKSDPYMQSRMLKKSKVEPYIHLSIKETFDFFGAEESNKKVLFPKFWQNADKNKKVDILINEFEQYFLTNNKIKNNESSKESQVIN